MSIRAKFTVDNREIKKGLQEVDQQAKNTGNTIKSSMEQANKGFDSANKLGSKMGGTLKNLQEAFMGMLSPIGLITTGITALGALAVKVWDMMTVSAEEYAKKASNAVENANANLEKTLKQERTDSGYLDRLIEISKAENISNAMKVEAIELISLLSKRYGDLGISIDIATGKIAGLDKAQVALLRKQQEMQISAAKISMDAQKMAVNSAAEGAVGERNINKKLNANYNIFGDSKVASVKTTPYGGVTNIQYTSEKTEKWNKGTLDDKLNIANEMAKNATTNKDIEKWQKLAHEIEKLKLAQEQYNTAVKYGKTSEEEYANSLKKRSQQISALSATTYKQASNKTRADREQSIEKETYAKLSTIDKIAYNEDKKEKEIAVQTSLDKSIANNKKKLADLESQAKALEPNVKNSKKVQDEYLVITEEIAKVNLDIAKSEAKKEESLTKTYNLNKEILSLSVKAADYYADQNKAIQNEIDIAKLKLNGLTEEAEELRLINELKAKGIDIDNDEVSAILAKRKELQNLQGNVDLQKDFKSQGEKMQVQAMKAAGFAKEAAQLEAIRNAEKVKGSKLTEDELDKIKQLMSLQIQMNDPMNKLNFSGLDTKTNELTARGGFSSGAVITNKDTVNQQIRDFSQRQVQILNSIYNTLKTGGII